MVIVACAIHSWATIATVAIEAVAIGLWWWWHWCMFNPMEIGSGIHLMSAVHFIHHTIAIVTIFLWNRIN